MSRFSPPQRHDRAENQQQWSKWLAGKLLKVVLSGFFIRGFGSLRCTAPGLWKPAYFLYHLPPPPPPKVIRKAVKVFSIHSSLLLLLRSVATSPSCELLFFILCFLVFFKVWLLNNCSCWLQKLPHWVPFGLYVREITERILKKRRQSRVLGKLEQCSYATWLQVKKFQSGCQVLPQPRLCTGLAI